MSHTVAVEVGGTTVNINVSQVGERGVPLLFVHGIPTNARLWRHVQAALGGRYRTFAMDMIGYGESDMPVDSLKYTLSNQAEAVKGVIDALGIRGDAVLVGHDHGGGVSQIFAARHPEYLSRLVLVNPVSFDYWPVLEVEGLAGLDGMPDEVLQGAAAQAAASFPPLMRSGSYLKTPFSDQNIKQNYLRFWSRGPGVTGFKSLIRACADPSNAETLDIDYSRIACPTMICWALEDVFMPREAPRRIKEAMRAPVRLQFIEQAGHWVQEDRPDHLAECIDDFVTEWAGVTI